MQDAAPQARLSLPAYIDSSMLSAWRACRRKFYHAHLLSLHPTGKSIHLVAGGAFAAGMEAARRVVFQNLANHRPANNGVLEAAYKAFAGEWGDFQAAEGSPKSFENTFGALEKYLLQYPPETDEIQPLRRPDGSPAVEYTFAIPLDEAPPHPETGDPFNFVGRFDLLGTINDLPCIVDEKTTSSIGFQWDSQWDLRGQFMGYLWACQQQGYQINTAVIRGIGILKRDIKFATSIKQYPQHLIERWYRQLIFDVQDIVSAYDMHTKDLRVGLDYSDQHFRYNFADSCNAYGGCAYAPLCLAKEPEAFEVNYVKHRWDPLAKQPVKDIENA